MKTCQSYVEYTRTNKRTGKQYKTWSFTGWGLLPDEQILKNHKNYRKGKYLIVEYPGGRNKYDIEKIVETN